MNPFYLHSSLDPSSQKCHLNFISFIRNLTFYNIALFQENDSSDDEEEKKKEEKKKGGDESEESEESDNPNRSDQKKQYMIFSDDEDEDLDNYECGQSSGDSVAKDRFVGQNSECFLDKFKAPLAIPIIV